MNFAFVKLIFMAWWRKYKVYVLGVVIIILLVLALIRLGYLIDATGFNGYHTVTTATTQSGNLPATVTRTVVEVPAKSFWDWMQLLIIPVMLVIGGFWLNRIQAGRDATYAEQRTQIERAIAFDNQREKALQDYIDKISGLLRNDKLGDFLVEPEVKTIARVRTITVLRRLDADRKGSVLQFLYEAGLIDKKTRPIDLTGADFTKANLRDLNLSKACLSKVDLTGANLTKANLSEANFEEVILYNADLWKANLAGANLKGAHISLDYYVGAEPNNTNLISADLRGADLSRAELRGANLEGADLRNARLIDAEVRSSVLTRAKLDGAVLDRADFTGSNITQEQISSARSSKDVIL